MKRVHSIGLMLLLTGCAAHYTPEVQQDPYGFFSGLWHGFVSPFAIVANLVSWLCSLLGLDLLRSIEIIGRPNTGFSYYVGFLLGLSPYFGGAAQ